MASCARACRPADRDPRCGGRGARRLARGRPYPSGQRLGLRALLPTTGSGPPTCARSASRARGRAGGVGTARERRRLADRRGPAGSICSTATSTSSGTGSRRRRPAATGRPGGRLTRRHGHLRARRRARAGGAAGGGAAATGVCRRAAVGRARTLARQRGLLGRDRRHGGRRARTWSRARGCSPRRPSRSARRRSPSAASGR